MNDSQTEGLTIGLGSWGLIRRKGNMLHHADAPARNPAIRLSAEDLAGDLIRPGDPLFGIVWINADRLGGEPCFAGTRVPIKTLFEYVEGGDPLDSFLEGFPGVSREQAVAVLEAARNSLLGGVRTR